MTDGPGTPESAISPQSPILSSPDTASSLNPPPAQEKPSVANNRQEQNQIPETSREETQVKETKSTNQVLVSFLEKQKYSTSEGESLPSNQQDFNSRVDKLIESLSQKPDQLISQEDFIQALNLGFERNLPKQINQIDSLISQIKQKLREPDISLEERNKLNDKINLLQQIQQKKEELLKNKTEIPEDVKGQIETFFRKLDEDPELKNQLLTHLESGNFNEVIDVIVNQSLRDEPGDSDETKQAKNRAASVIKGLKEKAPVVGSVIGILLLLMILQASRGGGGQG